MKANVMCHVYVDIMEELVGGWMTRQIDFFV